MKLKDAILTIEGFQSLTGFMIDTGPLSGREYLRGQLAGIEICLDVIKEICDED